MEILILTGKFGMGHWSAALSLQEQLEREGHQVHVMDFFCLCPAGDGPGPVRGFDLLVTMAGASTTCTTA